MGYLTMTAAIGLMMIVGCRPQSSEERWEKGTEWAVEKITDELDLTTYQQEVLSRIASEIKEKRTDVESLKDGFAEQLAAELSKDIFDAETMHAEFERREETFRALRMFAVDRFAEFHATLTPGQRRDLADHMQKLAERHN